MNLEKDSTKDKKQIHYLFQTICGVTLDIAVKTRLVGRSIRSKNKLSYGETGKVILIILGSGQLNSELYGKILDRLQWNEAWKKFIESLREDRGSPISATGNINEYGGENRSSESTTASSEEPIVLKFHKALQVTYEANFSLSPVCFLYLIERYLFLLPPFKGYFFTTKATFVEWLIYQDGTHSSTSSFMAVKQQSLEDALELIMNMVHMFLYPGVAIDWIKKSHLNVKYYHSLLVLRLIDHS